MEIEFKFCIPPERLAAVKAAARRGASTAMRLEARYFDTPDGALASRGIAFRLRREGKQWIQTVKAMGDGPLDREEHNVPVGGSAPAPRAELHAGTVAGSRLHDALQAASGPLAETYRTDVERVTRDLVFRGGVVELALDTGKIMAYRGTKQEKQTPVCELELELKAGPVAGLVAVATQWAAQYGLVVNTVSKAERGERLMAPQWARPAAKARPMVKTGSTKQFLKGRELQRAVVANGLAQILSNASEIVEGSSDQEHVHQLRIGIRRLRTALRELDGLSPGRFDPGWELPLVEAFRHLGQLRDREQILETIGIELREAGAPKSGTPSAAAATSPLAIVHAPAFQAALIGLMGFTARDDEPAAMDENTLGARKSRRLLEKSVHSLQTKIHQDASRFETLSVERQHRVRKRLKRLRYLAGFLEPVLGADADRFLDSLHPALTALGRLSDEHAASAMYAEMALADPHAWFGVGWLAGRREFTARACQEALAQIGAAPRIRRI